MGYVTDAATGRRRNATECRESTADNATDRRGQQPQRQQGGDAPRHQAVQHAVKPNFNSRQPRGNKTSGPQRDTATDDPPETGSNPQRCRGRRTSGVGIDCSKAKPGPASGA